MAEARGARGARKPAPHARGASLSLGSAPRRASASDGHRESFRERRPRQVVPSRSPPCSRELWTVGHDSVTAPGAGCRQWDEVDPEEPRCRTHLWAPAAESASRLTANSGREGEAREARGHGPRLSGWAAASQVARRLRDPNAFGFAAPGLRVFLDVPSVPRLMPPSSGQNPPAPAPPKFAVTLAAQDKNRQRSFKVLGPFSAPRSFVQLFSIPKFIGFNIIACKYCRRNFVEHEKS